MTATYRHGRYRAWRAGKMMRWAVQEARVRRMRGKILALMITKARETRQYAGTISSDGQ